MMFKEKTHKRRGEEQFKGQTTRWNNSSEEKKSWAVPARGAHDGYGLNGNAIGAIDLSKIGGYIVSSQALGDTNEALGGALRGSFDASKGGVLEWIQSLGDASDVLGSASMLDDIDRLNGSSEHMRLRSSWGEARVAKSTSNTGRENSATQGDVCMLGSLGGVRHTLGTPSKRCRLGTGHDSLGGTSGEISQGEVAT
ncbi:unnamed protein product [Ilex paraguariensis]|uniref:Uncharacterized protein n=1 Tax=Ilex paraguariensis TaxID=185542 RepID=A0ABC8QQA1_9AQUA